MNLKSCKPAIIEKRLETIEKALPSAAIPLRSLRLDLKFYET